MWYFIYTKEIFKMQDATRYQKLFISMRYLLLGLAKADKDYLLALEALEYTKDIHTGFRKDGATPEFQHQLEITHYLHTISGNLIHPGKTMAVSFLHDVPEDYDISFHEIEGKFGPEISHSVELLTKKYRGNHKDISKYFEAIAEDPIASVVKGADRINNQQSMLGVFTPEKMGSYITETRTHIVPMLKVARRKFVLQEAAYENLKFILNSQMQFVDAYLKLHGTGTTSVEAGKKG